MGVVVAICARLFSHDFSTPSFLPFLIFHHDGREMFRNVNVEHGGQKKGKKESWRLDRLVSPPPYAARSLLGPRLQPTLI